MDKAPISIFVNLLPEADFPTNNVLTASFESFCWFNLPVLVDLKKIETQSSFKEHSIILGKKNKYGYWKI